MSHFAYTRVSGVWNTGTALHSAEMADIDAKTFASINGDAGGTWSPSSSIIIGGAGLSAGPLAALTTFTVGGVATFTASVICQDTLRVDNAATFNGNVTLGNAAGDTLTVNATSAFASPVVFSSSILSSSTLGVSGNVAFGASLTVAVNAAVSGTLGVTGAVTFGGTAAIAGPLTVHGINDLSGIGSTGVIQTTNILAGNGGLFGGPVTFTGPGRIVKRIVQLSTGSNITAHGPSTVDTIIVTALSADVTLTINDTGAQDGDEIRIKNMSPTHLLTIDDPVNGTFNALKNLSGSRNSCLVTRAGGAWVTLSQDAVL